MTVNFTYRLESFAWEGAEWQLDIDVDATLTPYWPGNVSGPPEFSEPPSGGELEHLSVRLEQARIGSAVLQPGVIFDSLEAEISRLVESGDWLSLVLADAAFENASTDYDIED